MININIGLLLFIISVVANVAALLVDLMLLNNGAPTISDVARDNKIWATIFVVFEEIGAIGLGIHLFG